MTYHHAVVDNPFPNTRVYGYGLSTTRVRCLSFTDIDCTYDDLRRRAWLVSKLLPIRCCSVRDVSTSPTLALSLSLFLFHSFRLHI